MRLKLPAIKGARLYLWIAIGIWTATSVLGNALHVLTLPADRVTADPAIAIAVNTVPAVTLFLTIHIATLTVFTNRTMGGLRRWVITIALAGIGAAAFRLSWDAQTTLAISSGINEGLGWIYPFTVDAAIVICTIIALWTADPITKPSRARGGTPAAAGDPAAPARRSARSDIPQPAVDDLLRLADDEGLSGSQIAERVGRSKSWVMQQIKDERERRAAA